MKVGRRSVPLSRADKVLFPDAGYTKADLARYHRDVAPVLLRHAGGRPLALQRFPDGVGAGGFYQKQVPGHFPDWFGRLQVDTEEGPQVHACCTTAAELVFLADQACITLHHWLSRGDRLRRPDRIIVDLDPSADDFAAVIDAARDVRDLVCDLGLVPFAQLTGSRGIHVVAPILRKHDFDETRAFATAMARLLAARAPRRLTVAQRKADRGDRLFLDVVRNSYGQTSVAPYSVRARPRASVATPVEWDELGTRITDPQAFDITGIRRRLAARDDPWKGIGRRARGLSRPWKRLRAMLGEAGLELEH